jgi:predicted alpha/beta hydrolase
VSEHTLTAHDGWQLSVLDLAPESAPIGIAIAGHAMMVDRRTLYRPGAPTLVNTLIALGWRVLVPELRGRRKSGPEPREGADWSYDDLLRDVGTYVAHARSLAPALPLALVGHSLFAHASLAWLGMHPEAPVDAVAALATHVWNRSWDDSALRWLRKRAMIAATQVVTAAYGYMPSGRLGFGSCDESRSYWRDLCGWVTTGRWGTPAEDFHANLARLRCRVLHVVSDGDESFGRADEALRFSAILGERRTVLRVGARCDDPRLRALAPDHMPLVTSRDSEPIWEAVAEWLATAGAAPRPAPPAAAD